jgi:hypothetical protein
VHSALVLAPGYTSFLHEFVKFSTAIVMISMFIMVVTVVVKSPVYINRA